MYKSSYKNLKIWQKAMEIVEQAYRFTKRFPSEELYTLTSQIRRAAISIPSNIAEGSQRVSDREFSNFILIARGSLAEVDPQFLLSEKLNYLVRGDLDDFLKQTDELSRMLFSFHEKLSAQSSQPKAL